MLLQYSNARHGEPHFNFSIECRKMRFKSKIKSHIKTLKTGSKAWIYYSSTKFKKIEVLRHIKKCSTTINVRL